MLSGMSHTGGIWHASVWPLPPSAYGWCMLGAIGLSLFFWRRLARADERLLAIYASALLAAFVGAKLVYIFSEGWVSKDGVIFWQTWWTGKSILGGLLGGYAGVELAKMATGYRRATGDWFAAIVPWGILLGRAGCLSYGCCLGRPHAASWFTLADRDGIERWPAVPVEMAFNLAMGCFFLLLRQGARLPGQHFHLYLIAYGVFRFLHESQRDTPRLLGPVTGYQIAAVGLIVLGLYGYWKRRRAGLDPPASRGAPSAEVAARAWR